ncbi:MAG: pilus assembly protein PilM [Verrucomicrobiota bacterium]|nr:pilus assembly protein PilM [Verrucomicrobiota bacterium]
MPAAQGWNVVRPSGQNGSWSINAVASLAETVPLLNSTSHVVLALPINAVLSQRLRLPTVEKAEFAEMVRIQVEKALPFPPDEVTSDFEVIEENEQGSVVSAVAVHNEKLSEIAAPLLAGGIIPRQVTLYAAQRAATHASDGRAFLIYPEDASLVYAISENGKVGFTRSIQSGDAAQLHRDLPQFALSAELQGVNTAVPVVLVDEALSGMSETLQGMFGARADVMTVETPPASTQLNLLPDSWRVRRAEVERQAQWKKRLIYAAVAYVAILLLFFAYLGVMKYRVRQLDRAIAKNEPTTAFIKKTEATWKALSPAIDPHYYPIEVLLAIFQSLPSPDVQITTFNQSARQVAIDGEAPSATLAYQFAEAVKKNPDLKTFQFEMAAPRILPNEHAQFRLEGKPK